MSFFKWVCFAVIYKPGSNSNLVATNSTLSSVQFDYKKIQTKVKDQEPGKDIRRILSSIAESQCVDESGFCQIPFRLFNSTQDIRSIMILASDIASGAQIMFTTAIRWFAKKPKPKLKPIELKTSPEQTQTITRVIFDIVKEHGPLTIAETWEHVKDVGVRGLTSKRHMKIILRWMRERQKLRLICNHVGPHKQFLYTTWFTNPKVMPSKSNVDSSRPQ